MKKLRDLMSITWYKYPKGELWIGLFVGNLVAIDFTIRPFWIRFKWTGKISKFRYLKIPKIPEGETKTTTNSTSWLTITGVCK